MLMKFGYFIFTIGYRSRPRHSNRGRYHLAPRWVGHVQLNLICIFKSIFKDNRAVTVSDIHIRIVMTKTFHDNSIVAVYWKLNIYETISRIHFWPMNYTRNTCVGRPLRLFTPNITGAKPPPHTSHQDTGAKLFMVIIICVVLTWYQQSLLLISTSLFKNDIKAPWQYYKSRLTQSHTISYQNYLLFNDNHNLCLKSHVSF